MLSRSLSSTERINTIEALLPLVLGFHGVVITLQFNDGLRILIPVLAVAAIGIAGLVARPASEAMRFTRLVFLLVTATWLMSQTGGSKSYFLLWLFVLVAIYPLVISSRLSFSVAPLVIGAYCLAHVSGDTQVPAVIFGSRVFLLGMIGLLVADISGSLRQARKLQPLVYEDPLTKLGNRRYLHETGKALIADCRKSNRSVTVVVIDLNGLKQINDKYGHPAGDATLRAVGQCLQYLVRTADLAARTGGDEFTLLLAGADHSPHGIEGRIQSAIRRLDLQWNHTRIQLSAAAGAAMDSGSESLDQLIALADSRMYQKKSKGRGRQSAMVVPHPAVTRHSDHGLSI